jgi:AsmA protein
MGAAGLLAVVLTLPFLLPASIYKSEIEQNVTRATGRGFTISGPLHFILFPAPGLRAENIALANTPGGRATSLLRADSVRIDMRLMPLLSGHIEVSQITLDRPDIALEVDKQGHANWTFERRAQSAGNGPTSHPPVKFSALRIEHGRVTYSNLRTGGTRGIDDLDAATDLGALDRPVAITGAFALSGEHVAFRAEVGTPHLILQDRTAALDLSLASRLLRANFKGTLAPDGHANGILKINTPSARAAATWLGARVPDSGGFGALTLQGRIAGDSRNVALSDMKARLDGMNITGDLAIAIQAEVPLVRGTLAVDRLDLDPYLERAHTSLGRRTHRDNDEWSHKPITLELLKKFDAALHMNAGAVTLRKLKLGKTGIDVVLTGARLNASLHPMTLYGGTGRATLDIDARTTPSFLNVLEFNDVALQPFLSDTIGVKQIEGTGTIRLNATSAGASADAVMHGLNGKGSIHFHDGRIRGVDFDAVARAIRSLLGKAISPDAITQYRTMDASFTVEQGVLTSRDFRLDSPLLSAAGSGTVDVGGRAIDFRIEPQAIASIAHEKLTVGIPFRIRGPWRHVHYTADVSAIVKGAIENLEAGRAPFKGMFGKPDDKKKKKHKSLGDALKNMLGIH